MCSLFDWVAENVQGRLAEAFLKDVAIKVDVLALMRQSDVFRTNAGPECISMWKGGVLLGLLAELGVIADPDAALQ